jgi:hypothetical protein
LLLNIPDTITYIYRTPSTYQYELIGVMKSTYEVLEGGRFRVGIAWELPSTVPYLPLTIFGGSEEFTDDRFPNEGILKVWSRTPEGCQR